MKLLIVIVVLLLIILTIFRYLSLKRKASILSLSMNSSLNFDKRNFLKILENELYNCYDIVVTADEIVFDSSIYYFPSGYAYIHISQFNKLFNEYSNYLKGHLSEQYFKDFLFHFIALHLYFAE